MNRFLPLILAAVVLVGGAAYVLMPRGGGEPLLPGAANAQTTGELVEIQDMTLGLADAPVTIIEYASYTCPHCRTFHQGPFKDIQAEYVDTGKVQFIYREVYFDRPGLWASLVARCGGQERFFGISDLIYQGQSDWARREGGPEIAGALRQIGKVAGLTDEDLDACFSDATKAASLYEWYQANAEADDITSTPSFIINGEKYSNMSIDEFRSVIDGKLN
ncbi:DsbA family protein [Shimia ponticola]|uniref:DsbA family protein n=1 Tax=Shimia ponticola TaxID=2582893 RepID=UPI0011BEC755|nr:DsbA family protein [Shimia ponticola]